MTERNETPTEQMTGDIVTRLWTETPTPALVREAMDEIATLRSTVATLTAERDELREIDDEMGKRTVRWGLDDPALDGTDAAHPAWWRGNDDGVRAVVRIVSDLLDGKPHVGTFGNVQLEGLAQRIAAIPKPGTRDVAPEEIARVRADFARISAEHRLKQRDTDVATLTEQLREAREREAHARQFYGRRIDALERLMRTNGAITPNEFWSILGNGFEDARKDSPENVLLREIGTLRHDLERAEFARDDALAALSEANDTIRRLEATTTDARVTLAEAQTKIVHDRLTAAEQMCRIYFEIAEELIGEEEVRRRMNAKVDERIATGVLALSDPPKGE